MKYFFRGLSLVILEKKTRIVFILATAFFFLLILALQNGMQAYSIASMPLLPITERFSLFFSILFDITSKFTQSTLLVSTLSSILGGINLSLAYYFFKIRGVTFKKRHLLGNGAGMFLAFHGVGCAACGTVFLGTFLSFIGASSILTKLPYGGEEFGVLGVIILSMATFSLARKASMPLTC